MDDVYAYLTRLPRGVREMVAPCADGYTVYIDERLSEPARLAAYNHAVLHIRNGDFERYDVQEIEALAHREVVA